MGVFGELRCPFLHPPPPHFHPPPKKFLFLLSLQSFLPSCLLSEVYRACRPLWICLQGTLIQSVMLQNWFHVHWTDWLNGCFIFNNKRRMKRSWKKRKLINPPLNWQNLEEVQIWKAQSNQVLLISVILFSLSILVSVVCVHTKTTDPWCIHHV